MTGPLDPPYNGMAMWHEHAFPPDGASFPETEADDLNWACRYDAIEDDRGRVFVWSVGDEEPVCLCADRETAIRIARALVRLAVSERVKT